MISFLPYEIHEQHLLLTNGKSIFWEEERILILSDLHLGKSGHFRKSGIAIPQAVYREDLHNLISQVQFFKPRRLVVVGDMFHSGHNSELDLFSKWRQAISDIEILLVRGNHDILSQDWYRRTGIYIFPEKLQIGNFTFVHDIGACGSFETGYCFSGHIHPGITISGQGRQSLRFPCYYFTEQFAILPSFGKFTGTATIEPGTKDHVFAIVGNSVIPFHRQKPRAFSCAEN